MKFRNCARCETRYYGQILLKLHILTTPTTLCREKFSVAPFQATTFIHKHEIYPLIHITAGNCLVSFI